MEPEVCAKSGTEDGEQTALFCWITNGLRDKKPGYEPMRWMFAVPNGGSRGGTKDTAMALGARLKATGVRAGVSDTFLAEPRHGMAGLFIEMKKAPEFGGKPSDATDFQLEFGSWVQERGFGFAVCCGWLEARAVLCEYLQIEP